MAEEVRFELTEDLHPRRFSRPVHSTALPLFLCHSVGAGYLPILYRFFYASVYRKSQK
jgi:hypothetical protein